MKEQRSQDKIARMMEVAVVELAAMGRQIAALAKQDGGLFDADAGFYKDLVSWLREEAWADVFPDLEEPLEWSAVYNPNEEMLGCAQERFVGLVYDVAEGLRGLEKERRKNGEKGEASKAADLTSALGRGLFALWMREKEPRLPRVEMRGLRGEGRRELKRRRIAALLKMRRRA